MSPEDRKTYLSMSKRRVQPGSGSAPFEVRERASAFAPPQVRHRPADAEDLESIIRLGRREQGRA